MATLSHAWRSWKGAKGVALLAILAFAIGIGSATAIFTVINGVLLRPLPYAQSERFVSLYGARFTEPGQYSSSSTADLREYQSATTSFDVFGWFRLGNFNLTSPGEPQYVAGAAVTPSLAQNLGVPPALGQWFNDESGAVISNSLWRRLGGSPDIVGTALTLDERQLTITGVMPPEFRLPIQGTTTGRLQSDVWIYLDPSGANQPEDSFYFAYARRKPGVPLQQAQADAARVAADIARREPATHPSYTATVVDLRRDTLSDLSETLLLLFAAAGLLLLIACANVATLLLARSVTRARETAVRLALGAGRGHLALKYLVEAAAVSLVGAAAGVGLSAALVRVVLVVGSEYLPDADDIAIDWKVVSFGLAMAFLASALASLAPLWHALRTPPNAVLTEGVRATAGASVRRLSQALVVAEIALAFTLLAVSTILVVHLGNLRRVPTGFNPDNVLAFELTAPARIVNSKTLVPFQKRLLEALEAVPGVTGAALVNQLPLDGCCVGGTVYPEGVPPGEDARRVAFLFVTPGYMTAMGIPLRAGRFLTDADTNDKELFAVVNQAAVNRYWPDRNPVGAFGRLNRPDGNRFQVVGVVGDIRNDGLNAAPEAEVYLLATMIPVNPMNIIVRSPQPTRQLLVEVRRALQSVERTLTIRDARAMTDVVSDSLQLERVSSVMMSGFALAALLMATLGIYGVVSYAVRQRTVEMGTRMALGAVSRDLFALVVGGGFRMAGLGLAVGVPALAASVWLLAQFMEIRDIGWVPFASSTVVVALIASVASYVPAWRASLLSPMVAIRDESTSAWSARRRFLSAVRGAGNAVSAPAAAPPTLLTEFVAAARAADSFDEALAKALGTLCRSLGVDAAVLLEAAGGAHRARIAIGPFEPIAWAVPADGFLASRLAAYPLPLPFDPGEFDALREWAAAHRPDRLEEIRLLASADVRMAVPLRTRTEIMGVLLMGASRDRAHFGPVEKQILANCADQFALMIENARLTDRVVGQEALRRDLALAAEVQRRLLPADAPSADIAEFAAVSLPARSIGGDYYDFIQVGEQRIGIALADVSGKGITAALIMSVVQASLRIIASDGDISLPRLAARMNDFLYRTTPGNKYATFFYARVDGDRRQLRYVNAGHNPPYLVRMRRPGADESEADPPMEELTIGGAVVGMLPGMSYEEATVDLCSGDVLLAYTDGVTEAHNPDNVEFGEDRLKALLRGVVHLSAEEIRARIEQELKDWIKDAEQYDDLTFVVMKVH
ncbi:MAG TPA: ADOP family duplicated permease [Vicinamibacterales bacterium]|nr:ADOP family duplicated permease [Vicinamibacterales bacterium]